MFDFRMNQVEKYSSLPFHPIKDGRCDIIVEKPTYFMKLDAGNILYCYDFLWINLQFYPSLQIKALDLMK